MVEHRFGSQREWMIQRELERQKGCSAVGRSGPESVREQNRRARCFLVHENVFRLCKPRFPLDIEMITFS